MPRVRAYVANFMGEGAERFPRGFARDPDGRFAIAANEHGNTLVVYRVDPASGDLVPTGLRPLRPPRLDSAPALEAFAAD